WLLFIMLGTINIFWGLRWVQLFSRYGPGDAAYVDQRAQIVLLMIISSAIVLIGYAWLGRLLLRVPRQTNDTPAARE
ncbi:MAG: hypothetical protein O3A51_07130, partial [Verrucomicrobia bacterium]|nr:hypothetical protein [Verrucomicrobiota bacterium]